MDLNLFTALMRSEFLRGMQAVPSREPLWKKFTLEVPSTARFESYAWMTPSPGIARYLGHRRYAQLDQVKYIVQNLEFDSAIGVSTRDVRDDQIGGYPLRFQELGKKANMHPGRWVLQQILKGTSTTGFDGTNFFATAHNQGTGNSSLPSPFGGGLNSLTYTSAASSDGLTYNAAFLVHDGDSSPVKPLGYQKRQEAELMTNSGTPQSSEAKQVNYWIDLEGNAFFGYWWDAVLVAITNTPNLQDLFTIMDQVQRQFRTFVLPAALPTDPALYMHQDLQFNANTATVVCSTGLEELFNHALNEDRVGVSVAGSTAGITSNIYRGKFGLIGSGYMNGTGN